MVEIFSSHQAEVNALRRDLHMSRLALTQAGLKTDQILSQEEHHEHFIDGRSGVESNTSEVWSSKFTRNDVQLVCVIGILGGRV
jgi:hypothetical protein